MGYSNQESGDLEKLTLALKEITNAFSSVESILEAFGLRSLPTAQRYGILFGFLTFFFTISVVLCLLIWGGSFRRIQEQTQTGNHHHFMSPNDARKNRALLLDELLEARQYMIERNYPTNPDNSKPTENNATTMTTTTPLMTMLMNVAPSPSDERYLRDYQRAYRSFQESFTGGPVLVGRPEARYEAYARAYAGCGARVTTQYRRCYARFYEAAACQNLERDQTFAHLFSQAPRDIVGKFVRLETLDPQRHLDPFYSLTNGKPTLQYKSYDPDELWGFHFEGPFDSREQLKHSFVFQRRTPHEGAWAIRDNITEELIGVIWLSHDDPWNLSIQLEPTIIGPKYHDTLLEKEANFLLLDRLFTGYQYRRIQYCVDSLDVRMRRQALQLGFSLEGIFAKHYIVRSQCSRDSCFYGLINSDWKRGARAALFAQLYGNQAQLIDSAREAKEMEREIQDEFNNRQKSKNKESTLSANTDTSQ